MTPGQRVMYAYSYTLGLLVYAFLWITCHVGGPCPPRWADARTRIARTALAHAYGDINP